MSGNHVRSSSFKFTSQSKNGTVAEKRYHKSGGDFVEAGGRALGAGGGTGLWYQLGIEDEEEYKKERARLYPELFGDIEYEAIEEFNEEELAEHKDEELVIENDPVKSI